MKRVVALAAGLSLLVLVGGCGRRTAETADESGSPTATTLVQVRPGTVEQIVADETLAVTGSIEAGSDVAIASKIPGRVVAVGAGEGERVPQGRVLVTLDATAARGQVQQAAAGVQSARAMLNKAILSTGLVATQSDSAVRTAQAMVNAARARLEQAQSALRISGTKSGQEGTDRSQARAALRVAEGKLAQAQQALLIARQKTAGDVEASEAAVEQAVAAQNAANNRANQAQSALSLAELSTQTSIATAQQGVAQAQQQVALLEEGARDQERGVSASALVAAQANLRTAEADYARAKMLFEGGAVARASMDAAQLRLDAAQQQVRQAELQNSLVTEGPRQQQIAIARAQLSSAQEQFNLARDSRDSTLSMRRDDLANAREDVARAEQAVRAARATAATVRTARAQVPIAEADVANATQGVETARAALRLAEAGVGQYDIARNEVNAATQAVTQAEQGLRNARAGRVQPSMTQQDIAQLRGAVAGAEGALQIARSNLADHTIVAPIRGGIANKSVEVGSVVSPGLRLFRLVADDYVNFKANVPEEKIRFVKIGDRVDVKVDALPDTDFVGTVVEVLPAADERSRSFQLKVGVPNPLGQLRQGMFARGSIVIFKDKRTLRVPVGAVSRRDDRNWVTKLEGTKAIPTEVVIGNTRGGQVEVLEGNLGVGDTIAIETVGEITEEQTIELLANNDEKTNGDDPTSSAPPKQPE